MPILPETQNIKYPSLPYKETEEHSVILHLAAQLDELLLHIPIPIFDSNEKKLFINQCKKIASELENKYADNINIRVFKLKINPPVSMKEAYDIATRPLTPANYDVAVMIVCKDEETGKKVQEDAVYKELHDKFVNAENHNVVVAKNIRKAGESHVHDKFDQGVYLFNYFYVDDTEFDFLPVWEFTGRWFVENTQLDNSYLLKPISGDKNYQYINHCYWHRLSEFMPQIMTKKSLRSYVIANFTYNKAISFPLIYEIAS